jgi:hypothetical protein
MTRFASLAWALALAANAPLLAADSPACGCSQECQTPAGQLLFNGRDFQGWEQKGNWKIDDGAIARAGKGGSLTYKAQKIPDDFELSFEWKVGKGSNSGVYYRPGQYEYQILDNQHHADGRNPRTSAASLYFCMAPSKDVTRPVGQWNQGRIVCQGTVVQHWLNGVKVIDFDYADPRWAKEVELLRQRGGKLTERGAYLSLQDHGDPVWYRNFRLRALPKDEKLDRTPVTPAVIPPEALKHEQEILARIQKQRAAQQQKKPAK